MTDQEKIKDMELQIATLLSDQKYLLRKNEDQWVNIQKLRMLFKKIYHELQDIDIDELYEASEPQVLVTPEEVKL